MKDIDIEKIKRLDGSLLLVLRELLRTQRTTLAAERLGLSQSAVSHALARLRDLFGDALFVRRPYGLQPTRHALELSSQVDELLEAMGRALGLATSFEPASTERSFRLAAPDHLSTLLAPPLLACFAAKAPKARFAFNQRLGADALSALARDEIDLALGRFASGTEDFEVARLFDDRYCLIARRRNPQLRSGLSPARYGELQHVQISVDGDFRAPELGARSRRALPRRTVAAVPRFLMAFAVVGQSEAVAVVPRRLATAHARAFDLALHDLPFRVAPIRVLALCRRGSDPGTRWLLEQVRDVSARCGGA